jgi:hypothetical protein
MPDRRRKKASETEAAQMKKPAMTSRAETGMPAKAAKPRSAPKGATPPQQPVAPGNTQSRTDSPRVVLRDGVAYLDEYDIPIWRLEMGRRAGSSHTTLMATSPGLTPKGLDLAFAYAQEHKAEFDPLIREHSGEDVPEEDEGDEEDPAEAEADLDDLFTRYAQVFRRLAE